MGYKKREDKFGHGKNIFQSLYEPKHRYNVFLQYFVHYESMAL